MLRSIRTAHMERSVGVLAAAAKMARMPEMARDVNRVHKEAIFRMGEILSKYNAAPTRGSKIPLDTVRAVRASKLRDVEAAKKFGVSNGTIYNIRKNPKYGESIVDKSERTRAAIAAGISENLVSGAVRLAESPREVRDRILADDRIPAGVQRMIRSAPRRPNGRRPAISFTNAGTMFFYGKSLEALKRTSGGGGMSNAVRCLRGADIDSIAKLTPEEKQRARKLVVEMQEILDEIDRRLGPDYGVGS